MASKTPQSTEEATKQRIITHMNKDHQDSLIRYLQHYAHLSSFSARNAYLADISFDTLTILSSSNHRTSHAIPIKPPMTSWSDARPRVVAMDGEAVAGLGASDITVKKYKPPQGIWTVIFIGFVLFYLSFYRRANFASGSVPYETLLRHLPRFAKFCWTVQPLLFWLVVVLHAGETVWMARVKLEKHTVRVFSRVWWLWILSCLVDGSASLARFGECVREERAKKEGMKH